MHFCCLFTQICSVFFGYFVVLFSYFVESTFVSIEWHIFAVITAMLVAYVCNCWLYELLCCVESAIPNTPLAHAVVDRVNCSRRPQVRSVSSSSVQADFYWVMVWWYCVALSGYPLRVIRQDAVNLTQLAASTNSSVAINIRACE